MLRSRRLLPAITISCLVLLVAGRAQTEATPPPPEPVPEPVTAPVSSDPAPTPETPAAEASSAETPPEGEPKKEAEPAYDEVVVKGVKLQGHIVSFKEKSLEFETIYGKGVLQIYYTDLTQIKTHGSYRFIQTDGKSVTGRVAQISSRDMVVATKKGDVELIKPENIERVVQDVDTSKTFINRIRNQFPFTTMKFDLGWNLEAGANQKIEIEGGINIERRKAPTRIVLDVRAAYDTDQDGAEGSKPVVTKDEYRAYLIGEYDLNGPKYAFVFPAAERDAMRNIIMRAYPAIGMGYRLAQTGKLKFQVQAGVAYVYEDFIDYPDNEYWALHIGFEGGYDFTSNLSTTWKTYYYPGVEDYTKNWLFRTELAFAAKITQALSLNLRFTDTLDNTPDPSVGDNKFTTTLNLVFTF